MVDIGKERALLAASSLSSGESNPLGRTKLYRSSFTKVQAPLYNYLPPFPIQTKDPKQGKLFLGKLSLNSLNDEWDVNWRPISTMPTARFGHVTFKLNQEIFIAGGLDIFARACLSTDVYKMQENLWHKVDDMPFWLGDMTSASDVQENFCLIIGTRTFVKGPLLTSDNGQKKMVVLLFSKLVGFTILNERTIDIYPKFKCVSIA